MTENQMHMFQLHICTVLTYLCVLLGLIVSTLAKGYLYFNSKNDFVLAKLLKGMIFSIAAVVKFISLNNKI